jgi:hypothetical protein
VVVGAGALTNAWIHVPRESDVVTPPAGTRLAAIGRVAVAVPAGWADGAATCNAPTRDTVFFPYPQDCLEIRHRSVSSVALTTDIQQKGLVPTGRVNGHRVVAGPTSCRSDPNPDPACVEVFGVPDLHAYFTVTVPRADGTAPFDVIDGIRQSLTVLPVGQTAVPFVTPESGLAGYRATLEASGLHGEVRTVPCPDNAFCVPEVWGTSPAAGAVVPAGSAVRIKAQTAGR